MDRSGRFLVVTGVTGEKALVLAIDEQTGALSLSSEVALPTPDRAALPLSRDGDEMMDLRGNPFYLTDADIRWVQGDALDRMTLRQKTAQLFCVVSAAEEDRSLLERYRKIPFGGVTFRVEPSETIRRKVELLQQAAEIPLLVSANLESGGSGLLSDGTEFASQLEVSATGSPLLGPRSGRSVWPPRAAQSAATIHLPLWWTYTTTGAIPIIDTRTYGSDPEQVAAFAAEYLNGIRPYNMAVALKHFPGDGRG